MKKQRLDQLLIKRNIASDIAEAQSLIIRGKIYTDNKILDKAGMLVDYSINIGIKQPKSHDWVSRGGIKLAHALKHFDISPKNKICLDIGCSTGGFSDVLLHNYATRIYAVDVGYGEFDWKLRNNPKIILLERMNARFLTKNQIKDKIDLVVCDVSFVGLRSILNIPLSFTSKNSILIALIKPQFEVNKSQVQEKGIITDQNLHNQVVENIKIWLLEKNWKIIDITESPIKGRKGNKEFLIGAIHE